MEADGARIESDAIWLFSSSEKLIPRFIVRLEFLFGS